MFRMKWNQIIAIPLMLGLVLHLSVSSLAQEQPAVIPYQGQLADQEGKAVNPAAPITLVFRVYSQPVGGIPSWQEAHENISVVGGRFSVLLGAREPFPDLALFRQTVYLGVTVDDGEPATADIEMRPRQAIVPVIAANYAAKAGHADQTPGDVPVGGITIYGGKEAELPGNWKICNGQQVSDPDSRFYGQFLPDLRGLFVEGADGSFGLGTKGGTAHHSLVHRHEAGSHNHAFRDSMRLDISNKDIRYSPMRQKGRVCVDLDSDGDCEYGGGISFPFNEIIRDPSYNSLVIKRGKDEIVHNHSGTAVTAGRTTSSSGFVKRDRTSLDNRPPYINLHYIIRIK